MAVASKGVLFEYGLSLPPLALIFDFNPQQISRSRTVTIRTGNAPGARLGYDFLTPLDAPRAAQGVELQGESISVTILLDATDKMLDGDPIAAQFGVQPQIDTLRSMLEPKVQGPAGLKVLSSLTGGGARAFERQETASVLIFAWGLQFLPVFLTGVSQNEALHLPSLASIPGRDDTDHAGDRIQQSILPGGKGPPDRDDGAQRRHRLLARRR